MQHKKRGETTLTAVAAEVARKRAVRGGVGEDVDGAEAVPAAAAVWARVCGG